LHRRNPGRGDGPPFVNDRKGTAMSVQLPKSVDSYLVSENTNDIEALSACFTADAIVRDEGRTIEGLAAIKEWKVASKKKYQHTVEVIDTAEKDGKTIVTARVAGNFSGSPVKLQYIFGLDGDRIASLEIR
jgi:SnoaL-like domain